MKPPPAVFALIAVVALLGGCGSQTPPAEAKQSTSASASDHHDHGGDSDAAGEPTSVTLGAPVSLSGETDGTEFEVTYAVTKLDTVAKTDDGTRAESGEVFVVATVEVHSYRGDHVVGPDNTDFVFRLLDKTDETTKPRDATVGDALGGTVTEAKTRTGTLVFTAAEDTAADSRIRLEAAGTNGGDQTVIWKPE